MKDKSLQNAYDSMLQDKEVLTEAFKLSYEMVTTLMKSHVECYQKATGESPPESLLKDEREWKIHFILTAQKNLLPQEPTHD